MKTLPTNKFNSKLLQKRDQPNYRLVTDLVYFVHKYWCNHELPIDLSFMNNFSNLRIKTYSWFARKNHLSLSEVITYFNSDSGSCYYKVATNQYLIFYNDFIDNPQHNRWTLAHELGHYLLKHNEICDTAVMSRNTLCNTEYKIYEQEANAFARNLLAPLNVVCSILDKFSVTGIMDLCDLSYEASNNILTYITNGLQMGIGYNCESPTTKLFKRFIHNKKYIRSCCSCNYNFQSLNAKFCPMCGHNVLIKGESKNKMKYITNFLIDTNGNLLECPICHNEELNNEKFCKICGTHLINMCSNVEEDEWGNQIGGCGEIVDFNARFCSHCGSPTTFFNFGLLCDYTKYNHKQEMLNLFWKEVLDELKSNAKIMLYTNLLNSNLLENKKDTFTINLNNSTTFSEVVLSKKENILDLKGAIESKYKKDFKLNIYSHQSQKYILEEDTIPF